MKANELMIGDWVYSSFYYNSTKPCRITGIRTFDIKDVYAFVYIDKVENIKDINSLTPIPITPEILEKNGFKRHNSYHYIYTDNFCKVCVSFAPRIEIDGMDLGEPPIHVSIEGALFDIKMCISSIHQLQHAFRLCGITREIIL